MREFLLKEGIARAYGLYALSVIKGRALPDIRDGLKPVQRRILFAMYEGGYRYNKPFRKSARIVGEVMGKYHPHGDSPIYEAMVRMAQDFSMSINLVAGQGNFGSIDGDNAASMRYTEAKLAEVSEYLLQDYEKQTVPFRLNYDESIEMPEVLPAQFPNLIVNGASGIAVGMATSIPTHNLGEVMDAVCAMLENEDISLQEIMQHIKGPDFPTGGAMFGGKNLELGYSNGRGKVILRGEIKQEKLKNRDAMIITSIPYQVSKPKLMERIAELIEEGPLEGIADLRDESGSNIRVVLELKKDANYEILEQRLYAHTSLQTSISINMVAIDDEQPRVFNLPEMLRIFLKFREEVVVKRAEFLLRKTMEKAHIVWGLALATKMLDRIIKCIRESEDPKAAELALQAIEWPKSDYMPLLDILGEDEEVEDPYHFSKAQAKGILDLKLQKITKLERGNLLEELEQLGKFIQEQKKIIIDRPYRLQLMKGEFLTIKEKFGVPRRTKLLSYIDDITEESLITREEVIIILTANGYIKRIKAEEYRVQNRGGKGKIAHRREDDPISNIFITNTHANVLFFTSIGKVFSMKAYQIPEGSANSRGRAAINLFKIGENEIITTIMPVDEIETKTLVFITEKGTIRRNLISDFSNIRSDGKIAMKLEEGNYLKNVIMADEDDDLLLTSSNGNSIRFGVGDIRIFESRASQGVRAMRIQEDEKIIGSAKVSQGQEAEILCVTEQGFGKRTCISEYRKIKRGGKGSKTMNINNKTGKIVDAMYIDPQDDVLIITKNGQSIRTSVESIRKSGRVTSGVILMKTAAQDYVSQAIRIPFVDEEDLGISEIVN